MGAILGDHVEIGCNSVLNPGTIIACNTNVFILLILMMTLTMIFMMILMTIQKKKKQKKLRQQQKKQKQKKHNRGHTYFVSQIKQMLWFME